MKALLIISLWTSRSRSSEYCHSLNWVLVHICIVGYSNNSSRKVWGIELIASCPRTIKHGSQEWPTWLWQRATIPYPSVSCFICIELWFTMVLFCFLGITWTGLRRLIGKHWLVRILKLVNSFIHVRNYMKESESLPNARKDLLYRSPPAKCHQW